MDKKKVEIEVVMPTTAASRRELFKQVAGAAAFTALGASLPQVGTLAAAAAAPAPTPRKPLYERKPGQPIHFRGVNLGSWLVLEKWIVPSLFEGLKAHDEYTFCQELGEKAARERLEAFRAKWITKKDFEWLADHGINAVRIPVGYWVLGGEAPYIDGIKTLDNAFQWAQETGIGVVLDLHGAPGSQNGMDHSGRSGELNWYKDPKNIAKTLDTIEKLAAKYKNQESLVALELLNEPRWDVPIDILKQYYMDGYKRARKHLSADRVAIMMHDGFRPMEWAGFMPEPEYSNVILDTHIYQCFTDADKKRSALDHIELATKGHTKQITDMQAKSPWTTVGEWSLGLNPEAFEGMTATGKESMKQTYGGGQLLSYEKAACGWFFWTYKTETSADWNLRASMENGWLPKSFV